MRQREERAERLRGRGGRELCVLRRKSLLDILLSKKIEVQNSEYRIVCFV